MNRGAPSRVRSYPAQGGSLRGPHKQLLSMQSRGRSSSKVATPRSVEGCFACGAVAAQAEGICSYCDRRRALAERTITLLWGAR